MEPFLSDKVTKKDRQAERVDVRKLPKMKDIQPSSVAMEGPEPQPGHWPGPAEIRPQAEQKVYPGEGMVLTEDENLRT